jgi:hypothetical protein
LTAADADGFWLLKVGLTAFSRAGVAERRYSIKTDKRKSRATESQQEKVS